MDQKLSDKGNEWHTIACTFKIFFGGRKGTEKMEACMAQDTLCLFSNLDACICDNLLAYRHINGDTLKFIISSNLISDTLACCSDPEISTVRSNPLVKKL